MNFLRFLAIMIVASLLMRFLVLPICYLLLGKPGELAETAGWRALSWLAVMLMCVVNLVWFIWTIRITRFFMAQAFWWTTPIYFFTGLSGALSIFSNNSEENPFGGIWIMVWVLLFGLSFVVTKILI